MTSDAQRAWDALHPTSRGKAPSITPDLVPVVVEAYRTRTEPVTAVAARFNVSTQTLYNVIRKHAPELVRSRRRLTADDRRAIRAAYQEGRLTVRQIRTQFHISDATLYKIVGTLPRRVQATPLSDAERAALIDAYRFSPETITQIGARFGMSGANVSRICRDVPSYRKGRGSRGQFVVRMAPMPCPVTSDYLHTYATTMQCITPEIEAARDRAFQQRMARWLLDEEAQREYQIALAALRDDTELERAA